MVNQSQISQENPRDFSDEDADLVFEAQFDSPYARYSRWLLWPFFLGMILLTHLPMPDIDIADSGHYDKIVHTALFVLLTGLLASARPWAFLFDKLKITLFPARDHYPLLGRFENGLMAGLFAFGYALIDEFSQPYFNRHADWLDLLADVTGIILFIVCYTVSRDIDPRSELHKPASSTRFVRHAIVSGALTLISRLSGLLRDSFLAVILGLTGSLDAFYVGFMIPNLFRRLFGEGALSAAFVPTYTKASRHARQIAGRFMTVCFFCLFGFLACITAIIVGFLWLWQAATPLPEDLSLTLTLTQWMMSYMPIICCVAMVGGLLQVHGSFGPLAFAPILLNLFTIGVLWYAKDVLPEVPLMPQFPELARQSQADVNAHIVWPLAVSVVVAGLAQLIWVLAAAMRYQPFEFDIYKDWSVTWDYVKRLLRLMGPMALGLAVFQINTLLDSLIAMGLTARDTQAGRPVVHLFNWTIQAPIQEVGAVGALTLAQRLYQFPMGVFGIALATAIFPALAQAAAGTADKSPSAITDEDDIDTPVAGIALPDRFAHILRSGLRLTMFIGLPASCGLILAGEPLCRVLFEHGAFEAPQTQRVYVILIAYASAVWAYSMTHVLTRAFYAMHDSKTPIRISVRMVFFNVTLNLILIWFIGALGLAVSTAVSAVIQCLWLLLTIRKSVTAPIDAGVRDSWMKSFIFTVVMCAVLLAIKTFTEQHFSSSFKPQLIYLLVLVAGGAGSYFVMSRLSRMDELRWLLRKSGV